jgi:hypothetical protein
MADRSHRVVIELDPTDGPPEGRISLDEGPQHALLGWIDLVARLEALRDASISPFARRAQTGRALRGSSRRSR